MRKTATSVALVMCLLGAAGCDPPDGGWTTRCRGFVRLRARPDNRSQPTAAVGILSRRG